jgi:hypothetical protein
MAHGLDRCEVNVMIPLNPMESWMGTVISTELDDTIEQAAQVALTSLCERHLATTTEMPIALFPIHNQGDPVWQQRHEAMSDLMGPRFHTGVATMAEYTQYPFDLQHNLTRTVIQQRMRMDAYEEHNTAILHLLGQLKHENDLLRGGTLPPSDQDRELKVSTRF